MLKKSLILFIALVFLSLGSFALVFIYSEKSRSFIINKFELTKVLSVKLQNYFSKKINNNEISIEIETIEFLKPQSPTIIVLRLNNIQITSKKQKTKSKIKKVELGINYQNLLKTILYDDIYFDNLNFKDLTLNAKFEQEDSFVNGCCSKWRSVGSKEVADSDWYTCFISSNKFSRKQEILVLS